MPNCYYYDEQRNRCNCYVNENLNELLAENARLREFATETWELLTCNEPVFVWSGLQEKARELGMEVDA